MSSSINKKIFPMMENLNSLWSDFFKKNQVDCSPDNADAYWVMVDETIPYEIWPKDKGLIVLSNDKNLLNYAEGVSLFVSPDWVGDDLAQKLILNSIDHEASLKMEDIFGEQLKDIKSFKFHSHHKMGGYLDTIGIECAENKFDNFKIKTSILFLVYYLSYLRESGVAQGIFESEYGNSGDHFIFSVSVNVKEFGRDLIRPFIQKWDSQIDVSSLLSNVSNGCDLFDVSFFEEDQKLRLTCLWDINRKKSSPSFLLGRVPKGGSIGPRLVKVRTVTVKEVDGLENSLIANPIVQNKNESSAVWEDADLHKVALFVLTETGTNIEGKSVEEITDILKKGIKDPNLLEKVVPDHVLAIMEELQNRDSRKKYENELRDLAGRVPWWSEEATEVEKKMVDEIAAHDSGEFLNQFLSSSDDGFVTIHPSSEDEKNELIKVDGFYERLKEELQVVSGKEIEEDEWQRIKGGVSDELDKFSKKFKTDKDKLTNEQFATFRDEVLKSKLNDVVKLTSLGELPDDFVSVSRFGASILTQGVDHATSFMEEIGGEFQRVEGHSDEQKEKWMVKTLDVVNRELGIFSNKIGLFPEDLSTKQIENFKRTMLPHIMGKVFDSNVPPEIDNYFKERDLTHSLSAKIKSDFELKLADSLGIPQGQDAKIPISKLQSPEIKEQLYATIKDTLFNQYDLRRMDPSKVEAFKGQMANELSETLKIKPEVALEIIENSLKDLHHWHNERLEKEIAPYVDEVKSAEILDNLKNDNPQIQENLAVLEGRIQFLEEENSELRKKTLLLDAELKDKDKSIKKMGAAADHNINEALKFSNITKIPPAVIVGETRDRLLGNLKSGQEFTPHDMKLLAIAVAKEEKLTGLALQMENKLKQFDVELQRRQAIFNNEMKQVAKDGKALKEAFEKVKRENDSLQKIKVEKNSSNQATADSSKELNDTKMLVKSLENEKKRMSSEVDGLKKMIEIYKQKFEGVTNSLKTAGGQAQNVTQAINKMNTDNRMLEISKRSLEEKMQMMIKDVENYKLKTTKVLNDLDAAKRDSVVLKKELESAKAELENLKRKSATSAPTPELLQNEGKLKTEIQDLNRKLKEYDTKYKALETKVKNAEKVDSKKATAADTGSQKKLDQMAENNKKLMKDLELIKNQSGEDKKQINKFKAENTKLQNEVLTLKREIEKAKKAA